MNAFGNDIDAEFYSSNALIYVLASKPGQVASELDVPNSYVSKFTRKLHDNVKVTSMLE